MAIADVVDVVVVGAGAAGTMAALVAAANGRTVALLDKDIQVTCNTQLSSGIVCASGSSLQRKAGVKDSPEQLADEILEYNKHESDPDVTLAICRQSGLAVDFLATATGLDFHVDTSVLYPGHTKHRMHVFPTKSGSELLRGLRAAANERPQIVFQDQSPATELILDGGAVVGVVAGIPGRERAIRCRAIVLAAGGFGAQHEMLVSNIPEMSRAEYIGAKGNTGDAIKLAAPVGASVAHMGSYHPMAFVCYGYGTWLTAEIAWRGGILVNLLGNRFVAEDRTNAHVAGMVLKQPKGLAIELYDQRIADSVANSATTNRSIDAGAVRRGDSLRDLAAQFDVDGAATQAAVDRYNEGIRAGHDEFDRFLLEEPLAPPFYAALTTVALAETQGGLKVDPQARVLMRDGTPIRNLYAAGGAAAGISGDKGGEGYLHGNGLMHAVGLGMIAGNHASLAR